MEAKGRFFTLRKNGLQLFRKIGQDSNFNRSSWTILEYSLSQREQAKSLESGGREGIRTGLLVANSGENKLRQGATIT